MAARRTYPDPLEPLSRSCWLVLRNPTNQPLSCRELIAGTDLRAALIDERDRLAREGWAVEPVGRYAIIFAQRDTDRMSISIESYEPGHVPVSHG